MRKNQHSRFKSVNEAEPNGFLGLTNSLALLRACCTPISYDLTDTFHFVVASCAIDFFFVILFKFSNFAVHRRRQHTTPRVRRIRFATLILYTSSFFFASTSSASAMQLSAHSSMMANMNSLFSYSSQL